MRRLSAALTTAGILGLLAMTAAAAGLIAGCLFPAGAVETTAAVLAVRTAAEAVRAQAVLLTILVLACNLLWLITAGS